MMFDSLSRGLQSAFKTLQGKGKLTEANMREGLALVESSLLEADVSYAVVQQFMKSVTDRAVGRRVLLSLRPSEELVKIVYEELVGLLGPVDQSIPIKKGQPTVLMLCGLQGSGKTTTCGKLAKLIQEQKLRPFLVAADLQRPAAIEQLRVLGAQLGVPVYAPHGAADPVQVCREGIEQAKQQHANVVILDTAGRLAIDQELMEQLKQIDLQVKPDQIYLVVDGMTGQDAVNSASAFHAALELDGAILTKLDGDARGGALLSVKAVTQVPIKFIGTGEHLDALEPFRPEGMASRILEMGDMLEVAREAHRLIDDQERERLEERLQSGKFSLEDFRDMIQKMRKPGLMQKMLGLMPGMGAIKDALAQAGDQDGEMARISGIIDSMTPGERRQPEIIDIQRRHRIARGSGVQAAQVSDLIKQFQVMGPLLQLMSTGKMTDRLKALQQIQGGMAGMPGMSLDNMKLKQSTGKRLTPKERDRLQKERERKLRQMKRKEK